MEAALTSRFFIMLSRFKYHFALHIIIFMWGFTGILGKLIHLDAIAIVWYRVIIAFVSLALFFPIMRISFRVKNKKTLLYIAFVGILVGLHWVTFYKSIQLSTASLGILCLATTTVHVSWLEPLIMKRPFSWMELGLSLLIVGGVYFVSEDFNAKQYMALAYGLASAFFAGSFAVLNAKLAEETRPSQITLYEMASAGVFLTIVLLFQGRINADLLQMQLSDFWWLLFLGILCTSLAFLATISIMKILGAFTVSLSINMEPIYTILLAIFILNEDELLNSRFYLGATIIVLVVLANGFLKPLKVKKRYKTHQMHKQ